MSAPDTPVRLSQRIGAWSLEAFHNAAPLRSDGGIVVPRTKRRRRLAWFATLFMPPAAVAWIVGDLQMIVVAALAAIWGMFVPVVTWIFRVMAWCEAPLIRKMTMQIALSADGVETRCAGADTRLPWSSVTAVIVEKSELLVVHPLGGITVQGDGLPQGLTLAAIADRIERWRAAAAGAGAASGDGRA
ncbi:MAG: hypothetical protein AAF899_18845 [Pseudomonadota bacterium]